MKNASFWAYGALGIFLLSGCALFGNWGFEIQERTLSAYSRGGEWHAGVAKKSIVPEKQSYLAGFGPNRKSTGLHDSLDARCVAISNGQKGIVFASLDSIGILHQDVEQIRSLVAQFSNFEIVVSATHTHSGPDTIGLWGGSRIFSSGRDEVYMEQLKEKTAECVKEAILQNVPARIWSAVGKGEHMAEFDGHEHEPWLDLTFGVLQGRDLRTGTALFTLVNFAVHPGFMHGSEFSADFPYGLYKELEEKHAGMGIFINGAEGNVGASERYKKRNWDEMERMGKDMGKIALLLLAEKGFEEIDHAIFWIKRSFLYEVKNIFYKLSILFGSVPDVSIYGWTVVSEIQIISLGNITFVTVPGEAYPSIARKIRELLVNKNELFILGLANDELGYAMNEAEFDSYPWYHHYRLMSPGRDFGSKILEELKNIIILYTEYKNRCRCTVFSFAKSLKSDFKQLRFNYNFLDRCKIKFF